MTMTDFATARANMVDGQVRTDDVTNHALVSAMRAVPRERFVPPGREGVAYISTPLPLSATRSLLDPRTFAKLVQLADIQPTDTVLDVGGGSGYSTAVLARLAQTVLLLESDAALAETAAKTLADLGVSNATVETAPLAAGSAKAGPFDVIVLNGAVPHEPAALLSQLKPGGRLVGIVTDRGFGKAHIFIKASNGAISSRVVFDASVASLPGFEPAPVFQF
jgi:protein-L-isoaspartate(D-aspartate) O-methyltransferase